MVTKDMLIGDIIRTYPATALVFARYHLECLECQLADLETLEHGAGIHNIAVDRLVDELNDALLPSKS